MKIRLLRKLISIALCCIVWIATVSNSPAIAVELSSLASWQDQATREAIINLVAGITDTPSHNNFVKSAIEEGYLGSWNDGAVKQAIINLVAGITDTPSDELLEPVLEDVPLASWNDGGSKDTIINFVTDVTNPQSSNFVEVKDRIAVFDNDGTLWGEYPEYFPLTFFKEQGMGKGQTTDAYIESAYNFVTTENNTEFGKPYVDLIYKPMVELLDYLRANDFQVYICSGGESDFIRSFAEEYYGIPPQNVIGSTLRIKFDNENYDPPALVRGILPVSYNDKRKKPIDIWRYIGKKPIMAVGNSTGDLQMLQYTDDHQGHDLMMLVRHNDAVREHYAEDPTDEHIQEALNEAAAQGWSLISVKDDFSKVFLGAELP